MLLLLLLKVLAGDSLVVGLCEATLRASAQPASESSAFQIADVLNLLFDTQLGPATGDAVAWRRRGRAHRKLAIVEMVIRQGSRRASVPLVKDAKN